MCPSLQNGMAKEEIVQQKLQLESRKMSLTNPSQEKARLYPSASLGRIHISDLANNSCILRLGVDCHIGGKELWQKVKWHHLVSPSW